MEKRDQKAIIERITEQLEKENLDAALLTSGDAIFYATGFALRDLYTGGQLGNAAAVVTRSGQTALVVGEFAKHTAQMATEEVEIISYPTWIYIEDYATDQKKEVQPDLNQVYKLAAGFITDRKEGFRLGVQTNSLTHYAWNYLAEEFGENNLVDVKKVLVEARAIKTPWEIELLRKAAHYSEIAMNQTAKQVVPGMTEADVISLFNQNAFALSPDIVSVANFHTIGSNFTPSYIPPHTRIDRGDVIRLDGGPNYKGYNSDLARTFAVGGSTTADREAIYEHLWAGYAFAIDHIGPGVKFSDIFRGIHEVLQKRGFTGYIRGHQGHSLGCSTYCEEYPFIGPDEHRVFQPGMVMNLEMPYYSSTHQTYNMEDTFLVTETGIEWFSKADPSLDLR